MKIDRFEVRLVRWPLKMKRRQGFGDVEAFVPGAIIRLETSDGIVGWGEAAPLPGFTGTIEASLSALCAYLRPIVLGQPAEDVAKLMDRADREIVGYPEAKAAVETALYDIIGKRRQLAVSQLLGGTFRDAIPFSISVANPDFDADLDFVQARVTEGVRIFKVKTGFLSHAEDLSRLERLSAILPPDAEIRIDYNQALEPFDAVRKLRDIEAFRPGYIEQPVKRHQHDIMIAIGNAIDTPLLADESVFTPADALQLARTRYAQAAAIKLMKSGGLRRARQVADILEAAGMPGFGGTMYEGGIGLAAGIHLVASTPNISLGAEFYAANYAFGVDILVKPITIENGRIMLPQGAGLGVDVDEDKLNAITVEVSPD